MDIFCLGCFTRYKIRRKKWWEVNCPKCNMKPIYAFAYDRKLTVRDILMRLFKFHFGDTLYLPGSPRTDKKTDSEQSLKQKQ